MLDADVGIGLGGEAAASSPLLADLTFPMRFEPRRVAITARDARLTALVAGALRTGATEIALSDDDVEHLTSPSRAPLPDTIAAHAVAVAESTVAIARGDFLIRLEHVGPGANLLGR